MLQVEFPFVGIGFSSLISFKWVVCPSGSATEWRFGKGAHHPPSSIMKVDAQEWWGNYHKRCNKVTQQSDKKRNARTY